MISMAGESYDEFFKHIVGRSETQLLDDDQIQNFFNEEKIECRLLIKTNKTV